jgi:hypothetical protein
MGRALFSIAAAAPVALAMHCGSFSSTPPVPAAADASLVDAAPSPDSSLDASTPIGCAARPSLTGFCADFEDDLLVAWRDGEKETLWKALGRTTDLTLVPSERPAGGASLRAVASAGGVGGHLEYRASAMSSVSLRFAVRVHVLPSGATGLTIAALEVGTSTINIRISESTERVVFNRGGSAQRPVSFMQGYPPLVGNWRTIAVSLGGSGTGRKVTVLVDESVALEVGAIEQLPDFSSPQNVSVSVGAVEGSEPGYDVRFDDVLLTP